MKVCTDACIFGAWIAKYVQESSKIFNLLDIGTGTGILSLMVAQKSTALIHALDIEEDASRQAGENFAASPWAGKLQVINTNAIAYQPGIKFDCIIANPPFFEDDLRSGDSRKNAAMHDTELRFDQLLEIANRLVAASGIFAVLLPYHRMDYFIEAALGLHLYVKQKVLIQHTKSHPYFRSIVLFSRQNSPAISQNLAIKDNAGEYTSAFASLLKDYYLYL